MQKSTKRALSFSVLIAAAVIFGMVVAGSVDLTPRSEAQREAPARTRAGSVLLPSFADIADETMPSVVSITSTNIVKGARRRFMNPFGGGEENPFEFFFGPQPQPQQRRGQPREEEEHRETQGGTGFVISEDGYIVTNFHVIEQADRVRVRLSNREQVDAKVVGQDQATDLALLKVEGRNRFTPLALGDSDRLRVGDWVMAIGDPLTFDKTVTVGVVSAKDRSGLTADPGTRSFENFIQTDAAINFGNSGGPLINVNGEVVGINTAMFRPAQNIGFAVPVNTLKTILPQLRDKGKVVRGYLGINIRNVDQDTVAAFNLKNMEGAFVESVVEGEPADKAGVRPGDTIVSVDNVPVKDTRDLIGYVSGKAPKSNVRLTIMRDGKEMTLAASLAERGAEGQDPEETREAGAGNGSRGKIGISVYELTQQLRQTYRIEPGIQGIVVMDVKEVSPAGEAGIQEGDVITQVNGRPVRSTEEFGRLVADAKKGEYLRLYVYSPRGRLSRFVLVKIE
ncbi:MAG: Do family serine endopeptidase [Thermoanaerobaculia bacterium]